MNIHNGINIDQPTTLPSPEEFARLFEEAAQATQVAKEVDITGEQLRGIIGGLGVIAAQNAKSATVHIDPLIDRSQNPANTRAA